MVGAPTITIHVPGLLRDSCAGWTELSIPARTVRAALEDLEQHHSALYRNVCDETGAVRRHLNVFSARYVTGMSNSFWPKTESRPYNF